HWWSPWWLVCPETSSYGWIKFTGSRQSWGGWHYAAGSSMVLKNSGGEQEINKPSSGIRNKSKPFISLARVRTTNKERSYQRDYTANN
ncbi:hypothetical protein, partial [Xanthomonas euvesicatoria]|uniref:hypothetical protein n=1 Tax=Xanthomonas euvesicatoria TaxID=456327 RepID=UPI001C4541F9